MPLVLFSLVAALVVAGAAVATNDRKAPVLRSASATSNVVTLRYSEPLRGRAVAAAFNVIVNGVPRLVTWAKASGASVTLRLESPIAGDDMLVVTIAGDAGIRDRAGNKAKAGRATATNAATAGCTLVLKPVAFPGALSGNFSLAPNISAFRFLSSRGTVRAAMVFVDFPDVPASEDAAALAELHTALPGWFDEVSYGRFSVAVTPVLGWQRMPRRAADYGQWQEVAVQDAFLSDVVRITDPQIDYSQVDFLYVVVAAGVTQTGNPAVVRGRTGPPRDGSVAYATFLGPGIRWNGRHASSVAHHELAHSLGLPDLYGAAPPLDSFGAVGPWDPMSSPEGRHFLVWQKWKLGWIDPGQLRCAFRRGQPVEAEVAPTETPGGVKAIAASVSPTKAYVVEVRRSLGYDAGICKEGVLVYTVDSSVLSATAPARVLPAAPDDPALLGTCGALHHAPMGVGGVYEDDAVRVDVLAEADNGSYRIRVTRK